MNTTIQRLRTPLTLRFEFVSCEFATMTVQEGSVYPLYAFQPPCPVGKVEPDQECRMCTHHRIIPLGSTDRENYRYYGYGAIFPVMTSSVAEEVLQVLNKNEGFPLTRPEKEEG